MDEYIHESIKDNFIISETYKLYSKKTHFISEEQKKKISIRVKQTWKNKSSEEIIKWKENMSKSWTKEMREEHGKRISKLLKGKPTNRSPKQGYNSVAITGIRDDLKQFFRSTWEANIARIFNYLGIKWIYEPRRFTFEHFSYVPDFYLPETNSYVEVSGYTNKLKAEKISLAGKEVNIQLIDKKLYYQLRKEYKDKILGWENGDKRIHYSKIIKCEICGEETQIFNSNIKRCNKCKGKRRTYYINTETNLLDYSRYIIGKIQREAEEQEIIEEENKYHLNPNRDYIIKPKEIVYF